MILFLPAPHQLVHKCTPSSTDKLNMSAASRPVCTQQFADCLLKVKKSNGERCGEMNLERTKCIYVALARESVQFRSILVEIFFRAEF
jgi:hypothetical protein